MFRPAFALFLVGACGCSESARNAAPTASSLSANAEVQLPASSTDFADVVAVVASGESGAYRFAVSVVSPDTGCDRFADYWEVVTPTGALVYRRVLLHSHVDEQPFVRTGGPAK